MKWPAPWPASCARLQSSFSSPDPSKRRLNEVVEEEAAGPPRTLPAAAEARIAEQLTTAAEAVATAPAGRARAPPVSTPPPIAATGLTEARPQTVAIAAGAHEPIARRARAGTRA